MSHMGLDACASRDLTFGNTAVPAAYAHAGFMAALGFTYATPLSTNNHRGVPPEGGDPTLRKI